jgi:amino acid adenylation domain-containing protein
MSATAPPSAARRAHDRVRARAAHPKGGYVPFSATQLADLPARIFEGHADRAPDAPAVVSDEVRWTYAQLDARANGIAHEILSQSSDRDGTLGLLIENSPDMVVAVLAALKSGRTFVPIDPVKTPDARIEYILRDSGVEAVLTTAIHRARAERVNDGPVVVEVGNSSPSARRPRPSVARADLAWIIYTSGSTGQPKGVAQSHANLVHFLATEADAYHICPYDRCAVSFSSGVNFWYRETLSALIKGASVYPIDLQTTGFAGLAECLSGAGITLTTLVPSLFRQFAPTLSGPPPDLRVLKLGAEPVLRTDVDLYKRTFPRTCILINRFGTTETPPVRYYFMDHDTQVTETYAPIGYPVPGSDLILVDQSGAEVPADEIAEIVVRSRYLTTGYWNRPEITAATFKPDPQDATNRLYFTGDVGLKRRDGCVVHLGRKDQQIQIRGYRVELAEIEITLRELRGVADSAAATLTDENGDSLLVGYVVPDGRRPSVGWLREQLGARLPDYMVPTRWVFMDTLPRTPNGKLHRKALPAAGVTLPAESIERGGFVQPTTPMELLIARHWRKVLRDVDCIGATDRFFDLGGESLGAMQTIAWIEAETGARIPPMEFGRQTLRQLAAFCERHQTHKPGRPFRGVAHVLDMIIGRLVGGSGRGGGSVGTRP